MKSVDWLSVGVGGALIAAAILLGAACRDAVYPTAEEIYTGELSACVRAATTVQESDACQRAVTRSRFPNSDGGLLLGDK